MKKTVKILLFAILVFALCLAVCGCAAKNTDESADKQESKAEKTPKIETIDSVKCKLERVDESITDENGNVGVSWFFDKLVIEDSNPAAKIINADMEQKTSEFFADSKRQEITEYFNNIYDSQYNQAFLNTAEGEVSYNSNGIISVSYVQDWFMGGVHNRNYDGCTYDLNTGGRLSLADLLSGSEAEVLTSIQNVYWDAIVEHYSSGDLFDEARATFEAKTLDDYKFFVGEDGEIYLIADTYEFANGAAGAYVFASGLL
ncbi:MAG: hypothetical protein Q4A83_07050 [Bacillota bacterium]|nr:hypothetical protein [Bacillota bacterium]